MIADFQIGVDNISFSGATAASLIAGATANGAGDAVFNYNTGSLTLIGVSLTDLSLGMFV